MQPPGFDSTPPAPPPQPPQQREQLPPQLPYEFTPVQDDVIRSLAGKMKFVGIFHILAACIIGLSGLIALFYAPLIAVVYLVLLMPQLLVGIWTIIAAQSFKLVVSTRGRDIPHLMSALTSLRKLYTLMFWLLIAAFALILLAVAAGIFLCTMGVFPGTRETSTYTALMF